MTVAYLINQYPQPSQSFIRREIAALEAKGLRVERFTLRRWDQHLVDPADQAEQMRTRVVLDTGAAGLLTAALKQLLLRPIAFLAALRLAMRVGKRSERGRRVHLIYLAEACVLLRWLAECGARHVHAHFGTNSTTVAMLCRALGGPPYSFTAHGPEEFDKAKFLGMTEKINRSAFVVAISEFSRSQLYRWCDYGQWGKIHIVRCGVDDGFLKHEISAPPAAPKLVCVGRLCEQKGQPLLVQAAAKLMNEGVAFELVLVGGGPMRQRIERLIDHLGVRKHVRLAGWMSNAQVREQIIASRAMVLPSFAEGLPVVIMEALALARPVISTYVAGIPELVQVGESGWLVPPGAVEPLVAAMREALAASPERLAEMGRAGREAVLKQHDASVEAQRLAALFPDGAKEG